MMVFTNSLTRSLQVYHSFPSSAFSLVKMSCDCCNFYLCVSHVCSLCMPCTSPCLDRDDVSLAPSFLFLSMSSWLFALGFDRVLRNGDVGNLCFEGTAYLRPQLLSSQVKPQLIASPPKPRLVLFTILRAGGGCPGKFKL